MATKNDEIVLSYEDVLLRESDLELLDPEMSQFIKSAQQSHDTVNDLKRILNDDYYASKDVFFVPINDCDISSYGGNHWSLLVFFRNHDLHSRAKHYDSSSGSSNLCEAREIANILNKVCANDESQIDVIDATCIKQVNGYDCGIHLLCTVEALIHILFVEKSANLSTLASLSVIKNKRKEIKQTIIDLRSKGV